MKKILALCDGEQDYLYHMADYLDGKDTCPFIIYSFTDTEQLKKFTNNNEVELLLIAENAYKEEIQLFARHMIVLNESGNEVGSGVENINKYQASECIFKAVMNSYMKDNDRVPQRLATGNRMKIIGYYTPIGRSFQTTIALSMGQLLAKKHKTLYLNCECYSGFEYLLGQEFTANIIDVLYYFSCEKEKLAYKFGGMVQSVNGLDYIPPAISYCELERIAGERWLELFQEIEKISEYEYLILDLSEQVQGLLDVLRECYCIFTIIKEDRMAEAKMRQYEMLLHTMNYEDIACKTKKWKLPVFRKVPQEIDQLSRGEIGTLVKKMIEEEIYGDRTGA